MEMVVELTEFERPHRLGSLAASSMTETPGAPGRWNYLGCGAVAVGSRPAPARCRQATHDDRLVWRELANERIPPVT